MIVPAVIECSTMAPFSRNAFIRKQDNQQDNCNFFNCGKSKNLASIDLASIDLEKLDQIAVTLSEEPSNQAHQN
jgi:hypothetical protein